MKIIPLYQSCVLTQLLSVSNLHSAQTHACFVLQRNMMYFSTKKTVPLSTTRKLHCSFSIEVDNTTAEVSMTEQFSSTLSTWINSTTARNKILWFCGKLSFFRLTHSVWSWNSWRNKEVSKKKKEFPLLFALWENSWKTLTRHLWCWPKAV